jgi:hypothetical protein
MLDVLSIPQRAKGAFRRLVRNLSGKPTASRRKAAWTAEAERAASRGTVYATEEGNGFTLARYEKSGTFDYETYRSIQEIGNREKITNVFTTEQVIALIARHAKDKLGTVSSILCHGTRNAAEQKWFKAHFPAAEVLGTEISATALQFPMTIQWDFHEVHDGWADRWDLLYSNSWDHSFSPPKMFSAWERSLRRGGFLYLEHTSEHQLVDYLDLFGATSEALRTIVEGSGLVFVETLVEPNAHEFERRVLVFQKP